MQHWVRETVRTGICWLLDINLSLPLADQRVFLKNGAVGAMGSVDAVLSRGFLREIYDMDVVSYMLDSFTRWERLASVRR